MSLKKQTIHGLSWSLLNFLSTSGIQFIIGIILARLLSPTEYGLIGMTAIFTAISRTFVDSGFTSALVRKKNCTQAEYSTVFYYNIGVSILVYLILFLFAPLISVFFNEPQLTLLIRIISLNILVVASSQIQRAILIKQIQFKRLAIVTSISMVLAGSISITMALYGLGVWSLVALLVLRNIFISIFLWITGSWTPSLIFSVTAFKELFGFGSKLLFSSLINSIYNNIYNLIIGKYFSVTDLGFYTRARRFSDLVGRNINSIILSVTFPVMASISDDLQRLRNNYRRLITSSAQLSFFLGLTMAAIAPNLINGLLGPQWSPSIPYLQLLSFAGMLFPLHSLNLNILKVMGRSDLFLRIEIYKKLFAVPTVVLGIIYGMLPMMYMIVISSIVSFFINTFYSGRLIGYPTREQIRDILPSFYISVIISVPVYMIGRLFPFQSLILLSLQLFVAITGAVLAAKYSHYSGIVELKDIFVLQFQRLRKRNSIVSE